MTVKELREKLAQFDDNAIIKIYDDGWYETPNYVEEHDKGEVIIQMVY